MKTEDKFIIKLITIIIIVFVIWTYIIFITFEIDIDTIRERMLILGYKLQGCYLSDYNETKYYQRCERGINWCECSLYEHKTTQGGGPSEPIIREYPIKGGGGSPGNPDKGMEIPGPIYLL